MQSAPSSSVFFFKCTMRVDEILQVTTETRPTTRYWFGTWKKISTPWTLRERCLAKMKFLNEIGYSWDVDM